MAKIQPFGKAMIRTEMRSPSAIGEAGALTGRAIQELGATFERSIVPLIQKAEEDEAITIARDATEEYKIRTNELFEQRKATATGPHSDFSKGIEESLKELRQEYVDRMGNSKASTKFFDATNRFTQDRIMTSQSYEIVQRTKYKTDQHKLNITNIPTQIDINPNAVEAAEVFMDITKNIQEDNESGDLYDMQARPLVDFAAKSSREGLVDSYLKRADQDPRYLDRALNFLDGKELGSEVILPGMDDGEKQKYLNRINNAKKSIEGAKIKSAKDKFSGAESVLLSGDLDSRQKSFIDNYALEIASLPEGEEKQELVNNFSNLQKVNNFYEEKNIRGLSRTALLELKESGKLDSVSLANEKDTEKYRKHVENTVDNVIKEQEKDPVGFLAIQSPNAIHTPPIAALADTREAFQGSVADEALYTRSRLKEQGLPDRVLSKESSKMMADEFNKKMTPLEKARMLNNIASGYGQSSARVVQDMIDDKVIGDEYLFALHFEGDVAKSNVLQYFNKETQDNIKKNYIGSKEAVAKKVGKRLEAFKLAYAGAGDFTMPAKMQQAMQYAVMAGKDENEVYNEFITKNYEVVTGDKGAVVIPKSYGIDPSPVRDFLRKGLKPVTLSALKFDNPKALKLTDENFKEYISEYGKVIMNPSKDGVLIQYKHVVDGNDYLVRDQNKQPIEIKFKDIPNLMKETDVKLIDAGKKAQQASEAFLLKSRERRRIITEAKKNPI